MNVAINGFGRIGRLILRAYVENKNSNLKIVAINDLLDIDTAIHLLKYDSVHGRFNAEVRKISDTEFSVNEMVIKYFSKRDICDLPWKDLSIDLVMECTGVFKGKKSCIQHLNFGAKKVLISAPSEDVDNTIVFGVNHNQINIDNDIIVSCASCTTNCLAPIVKVIHENFKIVDGFVTTVHSYTGDQRIVDLAHSDHRRTRAAATNIIPTSTGATKAIEKIFPELKGCLSALSIRVPSPNVSLIDCTFTLSKATTAADINDALITAANGPLSCVLGYTDEELVSSDFNHISYSSIVDLKLTKVLNDKLVHIVSWYDNEWGFSNRMLDVALKLFA